MDILDTIPPVQYTIIKTHGHKKQGKLKSN